MVPLQTRDCDPFVPQMCPNHLPDGIENALKTQEFEEGKKKWQSCKDSNLNKVNQNHLCYRYTTGLHICKYFLI